MTITALTFHDAIEHVLNHYLSKPYDESWLMGAYLIAHQGNHPLRAQGVTVHRPTHNLVHTLRSMSYVPMVVDFLIKHGNESHQAQAHLLTSTDINKLMLCMLFAVTGRRSELNYTMNKHKYMAYRQRSGAAFFSYFQNKDIFTEEELTQYHNDLVAMGNPANKNLRHVIFNIAHKCDLGRDFEQTKYDTYATHYILEMTSATKPDIYQDLVRPAMNAKFATGDKVMFVPQGVDYVATRTERHKEVFIECSTNYRSCLSSINVAGITLPEELQSLTITPEVTDKTLLAQRARLFSQIPTDPTAGPVSSYSDIAESEWSLQGPA